MYIFVDHIDGTDVLRASYVEGDHEGPEKIFRGPNAGKELAAWAKRKHPHVRKFLARYDRLERIQSLTRGALNFVDAEGE